MKDPHQHQLIEARERALQIVRDEIPAEALPYTGDYALDTDSAFGYAFCIGA